MSSSFSDYVYSLLHVTDQWNQQVVSLVQMQSYGSLQYLLFIVVKRIARKCTRMKLNSSVQNNYGQLPALGAFYPIR